MSIDGRVRRCACLIAAAAAIGGLVVVFLATGGSSQAAAAPAAAVPACTPGTDVQTRDGAVCGLTASGVTSYLAIPYAAPPLGALRWRPPAQVTPCSQTLQATQAGPACPQPPNPGSSAPPPASSEDRLTLNVQVPTDAGPGRCR